MLENNFENNVDISLFTSKIPSMTNMANRKMVQVDVETHKRAKVFAALSDKLTVCEIFSEGAKMFMKANADKARSTQAVSGKKLALSK